MSKACFGRTPLPAGILASNGPAQACDVDKINQFQAELVASTTDAEERLLALKFLLHFVGDLHQPLHSSDNHHRGGNDVKVIVDGFPQKSNDELHGFWDTQFVDGVATPPTALAQNLLAQITQGDARVWIQGTPDDWARETFALSKADAYGTPPLSKAEVQQLGAGYVDSAELDVTLQLSRAGIRLAALLNKSFSSQQVDWNVCLPGR